jgi:hypothetical protein
MVYNVDNNGLARAVVYAVMCAAEFVNAPDFDDPYQLHQFLRERIQYSADMDPDWQLLRMPWRTTTDGTTDCKSSAIFIGGLAYAAGHHVVIRFTDEFGTGQWNHVYAIVNGIACDPLLPYGVEPPAMRTCDIFLHS